MKLLSVLALLLMTASAMAEQFRIRELKYEIIGMTEEKAVRRKIRISDEKTFSSKEELDSFLEDLKQRYTNLLAFSKIEITPEFLENSENQESSETKDIILQVKLEDASHFMFDPAFGFDTNTGFEITVCLQDDNFLGKLDRWLLKVFCASENKIDEDKPTTPDLGFDFQYIIPFQLGRVFSSLNNNLAFKYNFGESSPEFKIKEGLTFEFPSIHNDFSLIFDVSQKIEKKLEYEEFEDDIFGTTEAELSLPIKIFEIENRPFIYKPFVSFVQNYDNDSISDLNADLTSPKLKIGQEIQIGRIDWNFRFRKGAIFKLGGNLGFNFQTEKELMGIYMEGNAFNFYKRVGFASRIMFFSEKNELQFIGDKVRGVRDGQKYLNTKEKALKVSSALVFSADMPIYILTTDWRNWLKYLFGEGISKHIEWLKYFDFDFFVSPFFDMALTENQITGNKFYPDEGWYGFGIELLQFPKLWRSIVMRTSFGLDAGKLILKEIDGSLYDDKWRKDIPPFQISFSLGLHY